MKSLLVRCAAAAMLAAAMVAVPTAATAHETCETPEDVPVVVEFGSLAGEDRVVCAQHSAGTTAIEALHDAGVETESSTGAMPMVCRIEGLPTPEQEQCGDALSGDGYWAFMVAKEGQDWGYASVGLSEYELSAGDFVALKYHLMADGENVEVAAPADAQTRVDAVVAGEHDAADESGNETADEDSDATTFILPVAIAAVVLVAVAAFVVARRRRS